MFLFQYNTERGSAWAPKHPSGYATGRNPQARPCTFPPWPSTSRWDHPSPSLNCVSCRDKFLFADLLVAKEGVKKTKIKLTNLKKVSRDTLTNPMRIFFNMAFAVNCRHCRILGKIGLIEWSADSSQWWIWRWIITRFYLEDNHTLFLILNS